MLDEESGIMVILNFIHEYLDNSIFNIHVLSQLIDEVCMEEFMEFFFEKYIVKNPRENIIFDGYFFMFPKALDWFLKRCSQNKYRVWVMSRLDEQQE